MALPDRLRGLPGWDGDPHARPAGHLLHPGAWRCSPAPARSRRCAQRRRTVAGRRGSSASAGRAPRRPRWRACWSLAIVVEGRGLPVRSLRRPGQPAVPDAVPPSAADVPDPQLHLPALDARGQPPLPALVHRRLPRIVNGRASTSPDDDRGADRATCATSPTAATVERLRELRRPQRRSSTPTGTGFPAQAGRRRGARPDLSASGRRRAARRRLERGSSASRHPAPAERSLAQAQGERAPAADQGRERDHVEQFGSPSSGVSWSPATVGPRIATGTQAEHRGERRAAGRPTRVAGVARMANTIAAAIGGDHRHDRHPARSTTPNAVSSVCSRWPSQRNSSQVPGPLLAEQRERQ